MITPEDLDIVPTNELLEALKKRFDVFAMVGLFDRGPTLKSENISYMFRGEPFACLGASDLLRAKIEQHLLKHVRDKDNE